MHVQMSSLQLPESSYCEAAACLVDACPVVSSSVPSSLGSMAYVFCRRRCKHDLEMGNASIPLFASFLCQLSQPPSAQRRE